jgi:hypothetical protein
MSIMGYPQISLEDANVWFAASNVAAIVGAVLVLLGTIGVFRFGAIRDRYADDRIAKNEAEAATAKAIAATAEQGAADANERAAKANERAEEAQKANGELQKQIADANARAEQDRRARKEIEERMAPRAPGQNAMLRVAAALRPFTGTEALLLTSAAREPYALTLRLMNVLDAARWPHGVRVGDDTARSVVGILIEVKVDATEQQKAAASALAGALTAENLDTHLLPYWEPTAWTGSFTAFDVQPAAAAIRVTVGEK